MESSIENFQEQRICPLVCSFEIGPASGSSEAQPGLENLDFITDGNSDIQMRLTSKDDTLCSIDMAAKLQIRSWIDKSQVLGYLVLSICALSISMLATKSLIKKLTEDPEYCKYVIKP